MKLFSTTDIAKSVRKAYEKYTHVVLNRAYGLHKPVYFDTGKLLDLKVPMSQYASWIPASKSQLTRWKNLGGLLIEQDLIPPEEFRSDVTIQVECPLSMDRLKSCHWRNDEYGVIPHPVSWSTHEDWIDLHHPSADALRELWTAAAGRVFSVSELSFEVNIPVSRLQYLKNSLKPQEHWYVQKRLAPERTEFLPAWDWLEAGEIPKSTITQSGFKPQIEEMARFGYINLKKMQHFPADEPDWRVVNRMRERALKDLASVRSLVESIPDHFQK